MKSSFTLD